MEEAVPKAASGFLALVIGFQGHLMAANPAGDVFPDSKVAQLAVAACDADVARMDRALSDGADVNGRGREGFTPLFWAMRCRSILGVRYLLSHGADANARLSSGISPAWLAATYNESSYLRAVAEHDGDLNGTEDHRETSALLGAITSGFQNGFWENFYFTLDSGVNVNTRYGPPPGITAAESAVSLGLFDRALELVDRGYDRDLDRLEGRAQQRRIDSNSDQANFRERLLQRLSRSVRDSP
jgi:uncharacterized protein